MDDMFNRLVEEVNSLSIVDIKEKLRTKFYEEIEKLRKDDDKFSKNIEILENNLWRELLFNVSNLKNLVIIYDSLNTLEYATDKFTKSVNID